ncbi:MAG TPA: type IV secretory system conjugative DNA transfer family protein, partial [Candidatus Melainabacteria bacterium]|nr:type IV secretory system conjugative DNA transfer family protein [Candidatus Melainabacteria bacterium]
RTFHEKQILDNGHVVDRFMPRPLMTPDELMALDENLVLIFTPTTKPVKVSKLHWSEYELATGYPPPTAPPHSIEELAQRGGRTGPRKKRSYKQPTPPTNPLTESEKSDDRQSNQSQSESRTNQGSSPLDRDTPDLDLFGR